MENNKIILELNQSFILDEVSNYWMISTGEIDLFYASIDEKGNYLSTLKYIYTAKSGTLLFPFVRESNIKLIAISKGANLIELNYEKLFDLDHVFLKGMLEKWIKDMSNINLPQYPRDFITLDNSDKIQLVENQSILPAKKVLWFKVILGEVKYFNSEDKIIDLYKENYNLISDEFWITASKNSELNILNTYQIFKDKELFFSSFDEFRIMLLNIIKKQLEQNLLNDGS